MIIPQDRQDEERIIVTRIRRGERVDHFETVRQRKDGGPVPVLLAISPVKSSEEIVGASKIARDITGQKRSQDGLGHASITMTADTCGHLFPAKDDGGELAAAERALLGLHSA
jgi:hypothetical protein